MHAVSSIMAANNIYGTNPFEVLAISFTIDVTANEVHIRIRTVMYHVHAAEYLPQVFRRKWIHLKKEVEVPSKALHGNFAQQVSRIFRI